MSKREKKALEEEARRRGEELVSTESSSRTRSGQTFRPASSAQQSQRESGNAHAHAHTEGAGTSDVKTTSSEPPSNESAEGDETFLSSIEYNQQEEEEEQAAAAAAEAPITDTAQHTADATGGQAKVTFLPAFQSTPDQNIEQDSREIQIPKLTPDNMTSEMETPNVIYDNLLSRRTTLVNQYIDYQGEVARLTEKLETGLEVTVQDLEEGHIIQDNCKTLQGNIEEIDKIVVPKLDAQARTEFIQNNTSYRKVRGQICALDALLEDNKRMGETAATGVQNEGPRATLQDVEGEVQLQRPTVGDRIGRSRHSSQQGVVYQQVVQPHLPRLPEMRLSIFRGDPTEWPRFHQRFLTMIDSRKDITDLEKLDYLLGALEGEPKRMVEAYDYKAASYKPALQALERRVKKQRTNATTWINDIKGLKPPRPSEADDYFLLCDGIRRNINRLQSETTYNVNEQYNVDQLMEIIEGKLHPAVRERWRQHITSYWKLQKPSLRKNKVFEFIDYFEELANIKDDIIPLPQTLTYEKSQSHKAPRRYKRENVLATTTTPQKKTSPSRAMKKYAYKASDVFPCAYCKGQHATRLCKLKWGEDAWQKMSVYRICFCCLRTGHGRKACKDKKQCPKPGCKHTHHAQLHGIDYKGQQEKPSEDHCLMTNVQCYHQFSSIKVNSNSQLAQGTDKEDCSVKSEKASNSANLPVVIVPVGPTLSTPTAALLDIGSSHSFVSHKAVAKR